MYEDAIKLDGILFQYAGIPYVKKDIMQRSRANPLGFQGVSLLLLYIKNHFPRDLSHSRVSVFVTQDGVAGGMTKECFSNARRWVSMLALA